MPGAPEPLRLPALLAQYLEGKLVIAPCLQFLRRVLPLADLKGSGLRRGPLLVQLPQ